MDPNQGLPGGPDDPRRQQQATIGEGLQESRLNTDFIDMLKKYGDRALYLVLAVVLAYVGWNWWQGQQRDALDNAFRDLEGATSSQSVVLLDAASADWRGRGAVEALAQLRAAEIELDEARRGLKTGVDVRIAAPEDRLSPEEQQDRLRSALSRLSRVRTAVIGNDAQRTILMRAHWDASTAYIGLDEFDSARSELEKAAQVARAAGVDEFAALAQRRLARLDTLASARAPVPPTDDTGAGEKGQGLFDPALLGGGIAPPVDDGAAGPPALFPPPAAGTDDANTTDPAPPGAPAGDE